LESLSNTDNSLWKATKNILKEKIKIPLLRYPENSLALSNLDKANLLASDLENRFTPHPNLPNRNHYSNIEASLLNSLAMCLPTKHTSPSEVLNIIKNLKTTNLLAMT